MTEFTRPATWEDVKLLARLLGDAGVRYALVGGYALAAHGYSRFSGTSCLSSWWSALWMMSPSRC